ncbi:MAG: hypothetical protein ABS44_20520 [Chryseobacterium sp. SCN 40-13]|nr:MAG: hypothetical protein ABS44_20520 [Chryseobacterium sp. SCN 40-13]
MLSRIIKSSFNNNDIFNSEAETFPQEERLLENELSINLPARYRLKNKFRDSWINIISPVRATIVSGSPGAGKSAFVIRHFITQALAKSDPYTLFVYDFKFPDLSLIAYNHWLKNKHRYKGKPECIFMKFGSIAHFGDSTPLNSLINLTAYGLIFG